MLKSQIHEFHFIMDRNMKNSLQSLKLYEEIQSLSGVIIKILSFLTPLLKKEHKWGKQRESRYLLVTPDINEKREHVHVYFSSDMYREFKLMHHDLNWYSMAQLVRGFLLFFLFWASEFGDNVFQELEKLFTQWSKEDEKIQLTGYKFIRQLSTIIQHFQNSNKILTLYSEKFSPSWIFHL